MNNPKISIIMPVCNGEKYIREAIDSVLAQTFSDFEFIIFNDGSTDNTLNIIKSYPDPRIKIIDLGKNVGIPAALNSCLEQAQGRYIARMDADDICLPERLAKQVQFLDHDSAVSLLSTNVELITENGRSKGAHWIFRTHKLIKWKALISNPLFHPTVMARAEVYKKFQYKSGLPGAEDYDLWSRILFESTFTVACLPDVLLKYRLHKKIPTKNYTYDTKISELITIQNIKRYMPLTSNEEKAIIDIRNQHPTWRKLLLYKKAYWRLSKIFAAKESLSPEEKKQIKIIRPLDTAMNLLKTYVKRIIRWQS